MYTFNRQKHSASGQTSLDNSRLSSRTTSLLGSVIQPILLLSVLLTFAMMNSFRASAQVSLKDDVLILNEVGLSHALSDVMTRQIVSGVQSAKGHDVEFFSESLDLLSLPGRPSLAETRDWIAKKYGRSKLEVVVAVGPDTIKFLSDYADSVLSEVPVVICGSAADQAGSPNLGSRFTGTWQKREPGKTLEAALRLFPNTCHVFVVGGSSAFDRVVMKPTKEFL